MEKACLVQQKNGGTTTITMEGGSDVRVEYVGKSKKTQSSQLYRLIDLYPRANRVAGFKGILPLHGWIVLIVSVCIFIPGLLAFKTPSLLENEEALAHSIIFTFGGLFGIGAMIREIVQRKRNSSASYVFFHLGTRQPLFAFYVDEPSEEAAMKFCNLLEQDIEGARNSIGTPDQAGSNDTEKITREMENLCALFVRGVLSETEFSKAKGLLLKGA